MTYPCWSCGAKVDVAPRLRGWSEVAKWGAQQVLDKWGTLCDGCYERQEEVR